MREGPAQSGGRPGRAALRVGLAVLVALAIFFAWRAWDQAKRAEQLRAVCRSNLKCIALSLLIYVGDHGNRFPVVAAGREDEWALAAADHVHSFGPLWCPSDHRRIKGQRAMWEEEKRYVGVSPPPQEVLRAAKRRFGVITSYPMNRALSGVRLADLKEELWKVPLLEEAQEFHKGYRHIAYADGHVKAVKVAGQ